MRSLLVVIAVLALASTALAAKHVSLVAENCAQACEAGNEHGYVCEEPPYEALQFEQGEDLLSSISNMLVPIKHELNVNGRLVRKLGVHSAPASFHAKVGSFPVIIMIHSKAKGSPDDWESSHKCFEMEVADVNECDDPTLNVCNTARNVRCHNTPGSYQCHAKRGFRVVGSHCRGDEDTTECKANMWAEDIKECEDPNLNDCSPQADCIELEGSFSCACWQCYADESADEAGPGRSCVDADGCDAGTCPRHAFCSDVVGPAREGPCFTCTCEDGYKEDGTGHCVPIRECPKSNVCGHHADCQVCDEDSGCPHMSDTGIPYKCVCHEGYEGSGTVDDPCEPIAFCSLETTACHPWATCRETGSGYRCDCMEGSRGDGFDLASGCVNINECDEGSYNHDEQPPFTDCVDLDPPEKYTWACREGFEFDVNGNCIDPHLPVLALRDEHKDQVVGNHEMHLSQYAEYIEPGFVVQDNNTMHEELYVSEIVMTLPDELTDMTVDYVGVFPVHYTLDMPWTTEGRQTRRRDVIVVDFDECTCTDYTGRVWGEEECAPYKATCPQFAHCTNTVGSYECNCMDGTELNEEGDECVDIIEPVITVHGKDEVDKQCCRCDDDDRACPIGDVEANEICEPELQTLCPGDQHKRCYSAADQFPEEIYLTEGCEGADDECACEAGSEGCVRVWRLGVRDLTCDVTETSEINEEKKRKINFFNVVDGAGNAAGQKQRVINFDAVPVLKRMKELQAQIDYMRKTFLSKDENEAMERDLQLQKAVRSSTMSILFWVVAFLALAGVVLGWPALVAMRAYAAHTTNYDQFMQGGDLYHKLTSCGAKSRAQRRRELEQEWIDRVGDDE